MDKREQTWMQNFQSCKEYIEQTGSHTLPSGLQTASGSSMQVWVTANRQYYKQGKLSEEKMRLLDSIGILEIRFKDKEKLLRRSEPVTAKNAVKVMLSEEEYTELERMTEREGCASVGELLRRIILADN